MAAYFLHLQTGPAAGRRFPLTNQRTILGRHPSCDIMIPESAASRQHAAVLVRAAENGIRIVVEDLGSLNGTLLNGRLIARPETCEIGDELTVGGQQFVLQRNGGPDVSEPDDGTLFIDVAAGSRVISEVNLSGQQTAVGGDLNAVAKLRALDELGRAIGDAIEPDAVPPRLLDGLFAIFPNAERAFILLIDRESGKPVLRGRKLRTRPELGPLTFSRSLIERVVRDRQAILSNDVVADPRLDASVSLVNSQIRSVMCAPIGQAEGNVLGVLQVDSATFATGFGPDDLEVLASLAGLAARALARAVAHEETVRREKLRRDLELARKVQQGLLPQQPPDLPGYDVFDFYAPAQQIGGDYYDYVPLPDGRLAVVMADVAGKGISAALVMTTLASKVALALATEPDLAAAVARINADFCRQGWEERFATFLACVIDPRTHRATLVNAGHLPLTLRGSDGAVEFVAADSTCLPLGWDPEARYFATEFAIAPGETVLLSTDGISEALDFEGRIYGLDRLNAALAAAAGSAEEIGRGILADVEQFTAGEVQSDDICLICVQRRA